MIVHGNLDDVKTESPEDELENRCGYCDKPCDGDFCNQDHFKAFFND